MNDDEIIAELRARAGELSPVELAVLLGDMTGNGPTQGALVMYFKRAFPDVPLRILLEAGSWTRIGGGDLSDEGFNELLREWLV